MTDYVDVSILVQASDKALVQAIMKEAGEAYWEGEDTVVTVNGNLIPMVSFDVEGAPNGNPEVLPTLEANMIPYDVSWPSFSEVSSGKQYFRVDEHGFPKTVEIYDAARGMVPIRDMERAIADGNGAVFLEGYKRANSYADWEEQGKIDLSPFRDASPAPTSANEMQP